MTRSFKFWLGGLLLTALLVSSSVELVDKPVAIFIHDTFGSRHFSEAFIRSPGLSIPLMSVLVFVALGLSAIIGRKFSELEWTVLFCDISALAADAIKNQLKYTFGRTWPDSWGPEI